MPNTSLDTKILRLREDTSGPMRDPATGKRYSAYARPMGSITQASNELLRYLVEDSPTDTISQIRNKANFDPELTAALEMYISSRDTETSPHPPCSPTPNHLKKGSTMNNPLPTTATAREIVRGPDRSTRTDVDLPMYVGGETSDLREVAHVVPMSVSRNGEYHVPASPEFATYLSITDNPAASGKGITIREFLHLVTHYTALAARDLPVFYGHPPFTPWRVPVSGFVLWDDDAVHSEENQAYLWCAGYDLDTGEQAD